jgi:hypothetical protein
MRHASQVRSIITPAVLAGLLLGCKAGVSITPPSDGSAAEDHHVTQREVGGGNDAISVNEDGAVCAEQSNGAQAVPLDLYLMMDSSRSMLDPTDSGVSKWSAVTSAMTAFFNDPQSAGIGVGLAYFPVEQTGVPLTCTTDASCGATPAGCDRRKICVPNGTETSSFSAFCADNTSCAANQACELFESCPTSGGYCASNGAACPADCAAVTGYCNNRDVCDSATYATPVVAIGTTTLPGSSAALVASLTGHVPDGYTPTGPALKGAVTYLQQQLTAHPDHKAAVVLVTDGLPGGFTDLYSSGTLVRGIEHTACEPLDIPGIVTQVTAAAAGTPAIPTFVIGVFASSDVTAANPQPKLDMIAAGGGTGSAILINTSQDVNTLLQAALAQVRTKEIACQYQIPPPTSATHAVDFSKVNVDFTSGSGDVTRLGYWTDKSKCSATAGGWYYDIDPSTGGTPTAIITCDESCQQLKADPNGQVNIALGCMSFVIPG